MSIKTNTATNRLSADRAGKAPTIALRMDPNMVEQLDAFAAKNAATRSDVIRHAISELIAA